MRTNYELPSNLSTMADLYHAILERFKVKECIIELIEIVIVLGICKVILPQILRVIQTNEESKLN